MAKSRARAAVDVGSVIADTYRLEALLGRGGMGAVFLASHKRLAGKRFAIKILHTELAGTDVVARFRREAEIAARLNHPNIVGVIDYNVAPDGTPYLVLDYLDGETLAQRIARGPVPLDQVLSIVRQVGSALAAAHRAGIVHRDLKPQNILLVPTEIDGRVVEIAKVLDFGISKIRGSQTVKTQDSALLGTPQYMAPEQATGQHARVDERTDVFALGAIIYEMLSSRPAFAGTSIPEVMFKVVYEDPAPLADCAPSVPPAVAAAVTRAMAKAPGERFATAAELVEAITGEPPAAPRSPAPAPAGTDSPSARGIATGEAFAQTMDSGDHGEPAIGPVLASVGHSAARSPGAQVAANRPPAPASPAPARTTVDLHAGGRDTDPPRPAEAGSLVDTAGPTVRDRPAAAPPHRRSAGVIAAIALAGAAIAALAMYVAMPDRSPARDEPRIDQRPASPGSAVAARSDPAEDPGATDPPTTAPKPQAPVASDPQPADPRAPEPQPADPKAPGPPPERAAGEPATLTGRSGRGHTARPTAPPRTPAARSAQDQGDVDAGAQIKQAEEALKGRDYDLAERLASAVINSHATDGLRAQARAIHGTVQCIARNDQEAAQIDLRSLGKFAVLKKRLIGVCRSHGILLAP